MVVESEERGAYACAGDDRVSLVHCLLRRTFRALLYCVGGIEVWPAFFCAANGAGGGRNYPDSLFMQVFFVGRLVPRAVFPLVANSATNLFARVLGGHLARQVVFQRRTGRVNLYRGRPSVDAAPIDGTVFFIVNVMAVVMSVLFQAPRVANMIRRLVNDVVRVLFVADRFSRAYRRESDRRDVVYPSYVRIQPRANGHSVCRTELNVVRVVYHLVRVIGGNLVEIARLWVGRANARQPVVVRAFDARGRVPTWFTGHVPASFFRDLVVLTARGVGVAFVRSGVRVLRCVLIVFLITCFVNGFRRYSVDSPVHMIPIVMFADRFRVR